jgi:hypothetical protein
MSLFKKISKVPETKRTTHFIQWFEIPAEDFCRASLFYKKVFNIEIIETEMNRVKYGVFNLDSNHIKGAIIEKNKATIKDGVVLFFNAYPSVSEVEARITKNGGKILKNKTLMSNQTGNGDSILTSNFIDGSDLAYFSYFLDSEGNKMGLYGHS